MSEFSDVRQAWQALSEHADAAQLGDMNATVVFDLSADGNGQWTAAIVDGDVSIDETTAPSPDVTIRMKGADFLGMMNGALNPVAAFMMGRIRVEGDMALAMRLQGLFG
jgi:putative sterol carrier protein